MNDPSLDTFESRIFEAAAGFVYPPTPDIAGKAAIPIVRPRFEQRISLRPVMLILFLLVVLSSILLSVPAVRAAVLEFLQIGSIRILLTTPTLAPTPTPASLSDVLSPSPSPIPIKTATPADLVSLLDLEGQTTLEEAVRVADIQLKLPSYPADIGEPDIVFLQDLGEPVFIFVWTYPDEPGRVRLSLFQIQPGSWIGEKGGFSSFERTTVNGQEALWAVGPYPLILENRNLEIRRIVGGSALIWEQDGITYRIEGSPTLAQAIRIAESLQAIP